MIRSILVTAIVLALLVPASFLNVNALSAQCSYAPGTPVQLVGTPHLFIVDDGGVLHWGGDTRALAGHVINWGSQCSVSLSELTSTRRGDPWLTAGLPKIGDPIYLAKWEDTDAAPTLLHIQSIADVELFGINTANYGNFVLDSAVWEQRYGFNIASLKVGPLASAASFAWSDADRAAYGQLLANMQGAESSALSQATSTGASAVTVLPGITNCEKMGLDLFDSGRNSGNALQRTTDCLARGGFAGGLPPPPSSQAPAQPFNVRILSVSPTDLQITWEPVASATGYRIYGGDQFTPASTFVGFAQPGQSWMTIGSRTMGTSYCYSVTAFNAAGESTLAAPLCAATSATGTGVPSAPNNLVISRPTSGSIQLNWTPTTNDQDGYYIYEGNTMVATAPSNGTQSTITGLDGVSQHCYQVVAYNEFGPSAGSNVACAGTVAPTMQATLQPTLQATLTTVPIPVTNTPLIATPTTVATAVPSATPSAVATALPATATPSQS